jgi:transcriptional regulator with XRE-family HTH domain
MSESTENIFGTWLKETMEKKRFGGSEFAQRARLSRSALYFYLDGKRTPDESTVKLIAQALGVDPESVPKFERKRAGRRRAS